MANPDLQIRGGGSRPDLGIKGWGGGTRPLGPFPRDPSLDKMVTNNMKMGGNCDSDKKNRNYNIVKY